MEKLIVEEMCKNLKWYERMIVKRHKKLVVKVCNYQRVKIVNSMLN